MHYLATLTKYDFKRRIRFKSLVATVSNFNNIKISFTRERDREAEADRKLHPHVETHVEIFRFLPGAIFQTLIKEFQAMK